MRIEFLRPTRRSEGSTSGIIIKLSPIFIGAAVLLAMPLQDVGQDLQRVIERVRFHGFSLGLSIRTERQSVRSAVSPSLGWISKFLRSVPKSPRRSVNAPVRHTDSIAAKGHEIALVARL